jgi:NAD(P)H-dependent FMN reductase
VSQLKIAIIVGSTRPGRNAPAVARWVHEQAERHGGADFEIVDLADFPLPHFDEPGSPAFGRDYAHEHTRRWSERIAGFDGYVFVTPEYNHSTSGVLKNAIDYLYTEWNDKAAAVVSYGGVGGARAAEHLRLILGELQVADVRQQVAFSLATDFENFRELKPAPHHETAVATMFDQLVAWSGALRGVREARAAQREAASAA